jgi:hypothetical protein
MINLVNPDTCEGEALTSHLEPLLTALVVCLQSASLEVQPHCLVLLGCAAQVSEEAFAPYYPSFMPGVKYIYMCTYIYTYIYIYICMYKYINVYIYIYVYIYKYMYVCIYICIYKYICIYIMLGIKAILRSAASPDRSALRGKAMECAGLVGEAVGTEVYIRIYIYIYVYVYKYICMYIYVYIYVYICIYIYLSIYVCIVYRYLLRMPWKLCSYS